MPVANALITYGLPGGKVTEEIETAVDERFSLKMPPEAMITASDRLRIKTFHPAKNGTFGFLQP